MNEGRRRSEGQDTSVIVLSSDCWPRPHYIAMETVCGIADHCDMHVLKDGVNVVHIRYIYCIFCPCLYGSLLVRCEYTLYTAHLVHFHRWYTGVRDWQDPRCSCRVVLWQQLSTVYSQCIHSFHPSLCVCIPHRILCVQWHSICFL